MSEQKGVAVIGCGYWGVNYVRLFRELPETRVVAICDARSERLQEVSQQFPSIPNLNTDMEETLQLDDIEAVVICTQAASHYDLARRCLEAGKHVLVEKPMASSTACAPKVMLQPATSWAISL